MLSFARWTQPNFKSIAAKKNTPQFITIPYSHYVEFARWSLQINGYKFFEVGYAPGQHVLPVLSIRGGQKQNLSNSSYMTPVADPSRPKTVDPEVEKKRSVKARSTAVPLLVLADGRVLTDSWSICAESGFAPIADAEFRQLLDEQVGPLARQVAYQFILKPSNANVLWGMCTHNTGWLWALLWHIGVGNLLVNMLTKFFKPFNAEANALSRRKLADVIEKLNHRVVSRKGKFLAGDRIGMEDIALCSLFSPLVLPAEYAGGSLHKFFSQLEEQDSELQKQLQHFRSTEVGKYVLHMYANYRSAVLKRE